MRRLIKREGMTLLGWRDVPTDNSTLGESVKPTEPVHLQVFIGRGKKIKSEDEFERRLYILRKSMSHAIYTRKERRLSGYYPVSISCRTVVYKGMFLADQLGTYYPDLHDPDFESALALVHQRFSTNTFPTWSLAHPYRMIAHNGEINTLRGNVNWMAARQASVSSDAVRRRHQQAVADLLRGPVRHRLLRQRARIPGAGRLSARARHDDDDPRGLGGQSAHGRGAARLLRVQRRADGAVGRPGRDRLHQRPPDRRHARPQRPAPGALFRHPRRPHHHGVRDGRAADRRKGHRARSGGCSRARCCWSISTRAASFPTRSSRRRWPRAIPTRSGSSAPRSCSRTCRPRPSEAALSNLALLDRQQAFGYTQEDLRILMSPMAIAGRGGGRLHGQRHADLGAVRQAEAAVHLFQAELRAGDQPADRPDPRGAGHEPGLDHRAAAEPVRPRGHRRT